jgi:hypothetical protein
MPQVAPHIDVKGGRDMLMQSPFTLLFLFLRKALEWMSLAYQIILVWCKMGLPFYVPVRGRW